MSRRVSMSFGSRLALRVAGVALLVSPPAQAHPHVWITHTAVAEMHGTMLYAVQETWTFSKGFPVAMVGDLSGLPKSGPVNEKYTAMMKAQAFSSLRGTGYFTHVFADGKPVSIDDVSQFSVAIANSRIVYTFVAPLATPVDVRRARVELGVWDETFFVDFQAGMPPLTFDAGAATSCTAHSFDDREHPIFGGSILPQSSRLSC